MNKSYLLVFLIIINLIIVKNIYSKEIKSQQAFICNGLNSYYQVRDRKKDVSHTFENVKESIMLYKFKLERDEIDKQRPIGYIKFANSIFPPKMTNTLQICSEDDLNLVLNSICTMSEDDWPSSVKSLGASRCSLEKITGKLFCTISVDYADSNMTKSWDYDCKKNSNPVVQ
jgi:hypothetical protein